MEFTKRLDRLKSHEYHLAGGKGASLAALIEDGFNVPPGFVVITDAFERFIGDAGLFDEIDLALESVGDPVVIAALTAASNNIQSKIRNAPMPETIASDVLAAFDDLGCDRVAVRSSATAEDGSAAAWAGQLESYLNTDRYSLPEKLQECWASLYSSRAIAYRLRNSGRGGVSVAVVVQRMVDADFSGVAFSADPVSGERDRIVIETVAGLAEDLVSGRVSPDRYVLNKRTLSFITRDVSGDSAARREKPDGAVSIALETITQNPADDVIVALAGTVTRIEEYSGFPVDVEWAAADGEIFIVQSRPITTLVKEAEEKRYTWSNFNIAEVLPGVNPPFVTSMLIDIIEPAIRDLRILKFPENTPILRDIKGRMYFNLTAFENSLFRSFNEGGLSITKLLGGEQIEASLVSNISLRVKAGMALFGLRTLAASLFFQRRLDGLLDELNRDTKGFTNRIENSGDIDDLLNIEKELLAASAAYARRAFSMIIYPFSFYYLYVSICRRWFKDGDDPSHRLMASGGEGIPEIEAFTDLWQVRDVIKRSPDGGKRLLASNSAEVAVSVIESDDDVARIYKEFMDRHGHRCIKEMDFSQPRWREDPTFIIDALKQYLQAPDISDPGLRAIETRERRRLALEEVGAKLPRWRFAVLKRLLNLAAKGQRHREHMKMEIVKIFAVNRASLLKIGSALVSRGLIDEATDVFMFRADELLSMTDPVNRNPEFTAVTKRRLREYAGYADTEMPAVISDGEVAEWEPAIPDDDLQLKGIAVSHGRVEGTARVVASADEISRLAAGDILVTDHTDPGWTPIFAILGGVITNTGGLISHTSIVAREYGLPAVVNVARATERIRDGRRIILDGDSGIIELLPEK